MILVDSTFRPARFAPFSTYSIVPTILDYSPRLSLFAAVRATLKILKDGSQVLRDCQQYYFRLNENIILVNCGNPNIGELIDFKSTLVN